MTGVVIEEEHQQHPLHDEEEVGVEDVKEDDFCSACSNLKYINVIFKVTGKITSPASFYATAGGIVAAFISVFWSFGDLRLSDKLRITANEPSKVVVETNAKVEDYLKKMLHYLLNLAAATSEASASRLVSLLLSNR